MRNTSAVKSNKMHSVQCTLCIPLLHARILVRALTTRTPTLARASHTHTQKDTRTHKAHADTSHSPYFGCRIAAEALKKKEPGLLFEPFFRSRTKRKEKPLIDGGKAAKGRPKGMGNLRRRGTRKGREGEGSGRKEGAGKEVNQ